MDSSTAEWIRLVKSLPANMKDSTVKEEIPF